MRMMKKVLGMVTVLALSVSLLAGCGSTAASPVSPKRHPQRRMKTQLPLHSC